MRALSGQLTLCDMPVVPRSLGAGAVMRMSIACTGRVPGHHMEVILVDFAGFKIARRIFCEVNSPELQKQAMAQQGQRRQERYNYTAIRGEALKRQKARMDSK